MINRKFSRIISLCVLSIFARDTRTSADVLVTFDDALPGPYALGDTFTSEGVNFEVVAYSSGPSGHTVDIGDQLAIGVYTPANAGYGVDPAAYPRILNLDMDLAGSVGRQSSVTFYAADNGGSVNLLVNGGPGDPPSVAANYGAFDGTTINGVNVTVNRLFSWSVPFYHVDELVLTGDIDRIVFGGQETAFDDFRLVPEPATLGLWALGGGMLFWRRRSTP